MKFKTISIDVLIFWHEFFNLEFICDADNGIVTCMKSDFNDTDICNSNYTL